jgi:hypothetical protein
MAVRAIRVVITTGRECAPSQAPSAQQLADIVIDNISRLDSRSRMVLATVFAELVRTSNKLINLAAAPIPRAAALSTRPPTMIGDRAEIVTTTLLQIVLSSSAPKLLRHQIEELLRDEFIDVRREAVGDREELGEDA